MKLVLSIVCLTVCVTVAVSTFCKSEDDCKAGKCCVALSALQMAGKGLCIKLNRKKAKCNAPEAKLDYYGGKYLIYCPCEEGLECDTAGAKGFGRCKAAESTTTSDVTTDNETSPQDVTEEETSAPEVTEEETSPPEVTEEETSPPEEVTDPEVDEQTDAPVEDETGDEETETPNEEPEGDVEEPQEPEGDIGEPEGDVEEPKEPEGDAEEPEEVGQGPGGEPPRDDDCADWELPC